MAKKKRFSMVKKCLIFVAICLVLFLTFHKLESALRQHDIRELIISSRAKNEPLFEEIRRNQIQSLKDAGLIRFDPAFSSKTDVCMLDTDGLFVSPYHQDCYIRYVDGFLTDVNLKDTDIILRNKLSDSIPITSSYPDHTCGSTFPSKDGVTLTYLTITQHDTANYCLSLNSLEGSYARGPGLLVDKAAIHPVRSFNPTMIDPTFTYLVVEYNAYYIAFGVGVWNGNFMPASLQQGHC